MSTSIVPAILSTTRNKCTDMPALAHKCWHTHLQCLHAHTHAHVHTYTHITIYKHTHIHTHACTRTHARTCTHAQAHAHARVHACMHANKHARTCTHARTHALAGARMHTRTHAHTHACMHAQLSLGPTLWPGGHAVLQACLCPHVCVAQNHWYSAIFGT